jgi:mono/diheme cytochrome c family protein
MILSIWLACGTPDTPTAPTLATNAGTPAAYPTSFDLGRAPTTDELAAWDHEVNANWDGLPDGHGTVTEGKALYAQKCIACHGPDLKGGEGWIGPKLVATEPLEGFEKDYKIPRSIGNWWPHASTLFDYVHRVMPQNAPGSLTADQTYALVAFLLAENKVVGADFVADPTTLKQVKMPTKVKFVRDDRESTTTFR